MRCPKCAAPPASGADGTSEAGRLVRCRRCGTAWLARRSEAATLVTIYPAATPPRYPNIIEGEVLPPVSRRAPESKRSAEKPFAMPPPPFAPRPRSRRLVALGAAMTVIVMVGLAVPIAAAIPGIAALFSTDSGLVIEKVKSASLRRGGVDTIVVEGTLANHAAREIAVPAIRISLRSGTGGEVYSWDVQPSTMTLHPNESIGFRSALNNPAPGASQIAVSFTERRPITIGMR